MQGDGTRQMYRDIFVGYFRFKGILLIEDPWWTMLAEYFIETGL